MSNIIDKIQLSGITYDIGGGSITIDPTLDSGSTNPVANSAITTALDAKVNVADNAVSTKSIMYAYDKGDTAWKYPYNQGLRINQFFVKYTQSFENSNVPAWNNPMYITNDGSTTSQIYLRVNASNYQITSVASTSGDFTYALEGGQVNVTLPSGYYISRFAQKYNFQILYPKYVINGGQSAQALQNTENVLNDIYSEMPKRWITGGSISCNFNYLNSYLYDNNGNDNSSMMPLGTSIKGEGNKLDVYFDGQTIHQKILNTGSGNYCNVPNNPAWNYTDDLNEIIIHFNSGYTGSNTSYTILVQTIDTNTWTYSDNLYYDVANHTLDASSANYVTATTVGDDYTYSIKPKQEYSSYKILTIRENNWCNIAGIDNQRKEEYIITGVTTPSYSYQAQEIIDDLYSKVGSGITSGEVQTMIDESVSGKVDTSVYTAYTAATDTALASKQTTLTAGTGISIVDNVISAEGGGITSGEVQTMIDESISGKADSSAITESLATKVNVADNNVLAFSGVPLAINVNEDYGSLQLKTIYIKNNDVTQHTNVVFGVIRYWYNGGSYIATTDISGSSKSSSGITAITNTDTTAHTFTLENGVCRIDFLGSCYFSELSSEGDGFSFYYIHNNNYTSGQSSTVIENTVYDALTELGKDIVDMNDSGRFVNVSKAQDITGQKNFIGDKGIKFSQKTSSNKPGFVIYAVDTANTTTEAATFEFRPNTFIETISGTTIKRPLLYFGHYRASTAANKGIPQTVVGFRQYDQENAAAYHYLMPLPEKAKTPFSLTASFKNYFAPLGFKNGDTMITTDNTGVADFSSVLGGLKLVKLTQTEYDNLGTKDSNTLYVIVN